MSKNKMNCVEKIVSENESYNFKRRGSRKSACSKIQRKTMETPKESFASKNFNQYLKFINSLNKFVLRIIKFLKNYT